MSIENGLKEMEKGEVVTITIDNKTGKVDVNSHNPCTFCDNKECDRQGIKPCVIYCG